ncbi:MAG: hypothetical protein ACT4QG_09400 [Sporichthyaceae bacterium]
MFSAYAMGTVHAPEGPSAHRRHARRGTRLARLGLVLAVVSVTATVGVGTWVLGSGADAARQDEVPAPVAPVVESSQPPLLIAPPPKGEGRGVAESRKVQKSTAAAR